jgi:hypothetical protein
MSSAAESQLLLVVAAIGTILIIIATLFFVHWRRSVARQIELTDLSLEREKHRAAEEKKRLEEERSLFEMRVTADRERLAMERDTSRQNMSDTMERHHMERDMLDRDRAQRMDEMKMREAMTERETALAEAQLNARQRENELLMAQVKAIEEQIRLQRETSDKLSTGPSSGGYIVLDLSDHERPVFHDLLKGFEEYAKLKGYEVSFSIDTTLSNRIAFKFTIKEGPFTVGAERVRRDFTEYIEKVRGGADTLDDIPVVTSLEEHHLVVTVLKNRISFLHHSYNLSQNAVRFYEGLLERIPTFPALPAPNVVVHTGGNMDSRNYHATNSSRLIQGDQNTYSDKSDNIRIGQSFNERTQQLAALDDLVARLKSCQEQNESTEKALRALQNVHDELAEANQPDKERVQKWLETAKFSMGAAAISYEIVEVGKKLFEMFGVA